MSDKISIIIPCYNAQNYIDRCLRSIEEQTYILNGTGEVEIILINDASTDGTYEKLLKYEEKYPDNVLVISSETNFGPGTVRNIGLKYATGEYVSFVDADDVVDVTMLSRMYEMMKLYDVDVVECGYKTFSDMAELLGVESAKAAEEDSAEQFDTSNNNGYLIKVETSKDIGSLILKSFKTAVWGRLYKKSFIDDNELYFPEDMIYGEDNFFSGLAMLTCKSYYYINDSLYYYYNNINGIIHRTGDNERIYQLAEIMKLYINELDKRGFLGGDEDMCNKFSKAQETISEYAAEFEWYMIYKYFMDPVSFIISGKFPDWRAQVYYFGKELLQFFPEAYNNAYLNGDKRWADYATLLKESENSH
ncbi:MAG: glycosyltransferase [Lachnospiraceae bacterium]|nr:glycosyltransferase [Lachnospiraceae bacterium]